MDDALRRERIAGFRSPLGNLREDLLAQSQERPRPRQLAHETFDEQHEARADIADEFCIREEHLLDRRGKIAHMQNLRSARTHEEGRLLNRVVADRDDQVGAIDRVVNIVTLGKRGGAHVESGPARDCPFAHLRVEERDLQAIDEIRQRVSKARAACGRTQHHQRSLGLENQVGRSLQRRRMGDGQINRVRRHQRNRRSRASGDVLR